MKYLTSVLVFALALSLSGLSSKNLLGRLTIE
jgi:hypothetical protein